MRLHRLMMTAFGPFAGSHEVDFDALAAAGLYLVHGPTGAGKTSILDAVCYALFSDVAGVRSVRGVRCDTAPPELRTQVQLEFSCSGRRLRLTRLPEHVRPKQRGDGWTKSPAKVHLEEHLHGEWHVRSTRIDETADVIHDVLGMGLAQFQRVALLPQGEFATFLRADARDRHALLTELFDVTTFEAVEEWLGGQRRAGQQRLGALETELGFVQRQLIDTLSELPESVGGLPAELPPLSEAQPEDWAPITAELTAQLAAAAQTAVAANERAIAQESLTRAAHEEALARHTVRTRALAAQARRERFLADAPRIEEARARHQRATAAGLLSGHLTARDRARVRVEAEQRTCAGRLDEIAALGLIVPGAAEASGRTDALSELLAACRAHGPAADAVRLAGADVAGALREIQRAATALGAARATAEQAMEGVAPAAATVAQARERVLALTEVAAEGPSADQAWAELDQRRRLTEDLAATAATIASLESELLGARERALEARGRLLDLQQRRLDDLAGELAAGLHAGDPCPVCGSADHPQPALPAPGWSPAELAAAQQAADRTAEVVTDLRSRIRATSERQADLAAQLGQLPGPELAGEDLVAALEGAADRVRVIRAAAGQLRAARGAEDAAEAAARTAEQGAHAAVARTEAAEQEVAEVRRRLASVLGVLAEALADHDDCPCVDPDASGTLADSGCGGITREAVADGLGGEGGIPEADLNPATDLAAAQLAQRHAATVAARHREAMQALEGAAVADRSLAAALAEAAEVDSEFVTALAESPFADAAELADAVMPPRDLTAVAALIADHDRDLRVAEETLADPQIAAALDDHTVADPQVTGAAADQARAAALAAARRQHETERLAGSIAAQADSLLAAAEAVVAARDAVAQVSALADLVAGTSPDNIMRMRLSTFVLASRLERVVELANERLERMGEGRFRLEHDDALAAHGARSGLGLRVRDEWSGTTRATGSLSGGESFLGSLALALGLADALRESTGGVEVQTLFVDEGFGALDESSLDEVLDVLDDLRDGGRAVGVISHVPQLRARIPTQLAVTKDASGSALNALVGPAA